MASVVEHIPVMVREVLDQLRPRTNEIFVDATLGAGGHALEILKATAPSGVLVGVDWDEEALAVSRARLKDFGQRVIFARYNFTNMMEVLEGLGIDRVEGVLFDLGVSSLQLKRPERGFSFREEGPLDMRMDRRLKLSAFDLVNRHSEAELAGLIRRYGEERRARRIARAILEYRDQKEISTTSQLSRIVVDAIPAQFRRSYIHPATRTFQAIRIAVNGELDNLQNGIRAAVRVLRRGGRVVVIAFHSLEDGLVKGEFRALERGCVCPPGLPSCSCGRVKELRIMTKRPLRPTGEEVGGNPRARSAKLRAAQKVM